MNQIVKDKMVREIMVVANDKLFSDFPRATKYYENSEFNFEEVILENYEYMVRGEAEENTSYKQPIPYGVVVNSDNKIFVYKRWGAGSNAWESRLHSKIAFWVWGHIEREDENSKNILTDSLVREIEEEINIAHDEIQSVEAIWYLNEDDWAVSEVHFWIAYIIKVETSNVALLDGELENGEFISIEDLQDMLESPDYEVENWSKILFEPIKNILQK